MSRNYCLPISFFAGTGGPSIAGSNEGLNAEMNISNLIRLNIQALSLLEGRDITEEQQVSGGITLSSDKEPFEKTPVLPGTELDGMKLAIPAVAHVMTSWQEHPKLSKSMHKLMDKLVEIKKECGCTSQKEGPLKSFANLFASNCVNILILGQI